MYRKLSLLFASAAVLPSAFFAYLAPSVVAATNLIANSSVEVNVNNSPVNWLKNTWGQNTANFTYPTNGQNGRRSLRVQVTSYTSGDAKWYFEPVSVTSGQTYVYSDYYKSSVQTFLVAQTQDQEGNFNYFQIGNPLAKSSSWKKVTATFTAPANTQKLTIFHLINKVGYLQTDNFSLALADEGVTVVDNVPNNSVEQISQIEANKPAAWTNGTWGQNSATFTYLNNLGHTGSHSIKTQLSSHTSGDAKWYYERQAVTGNVQLRFTDYYQASVTSRVVVEITKTDGTQDYLELKNAPASSTWAKYTDYFTTPVGAVSLTVFHLISTVGYLITDDYSVNPFVPQGFNRSLVTLTFDDGWASQQTVAAPMLSTYNFPATFYITTGFLGTAGYMTNQMVIDLRNAGHQIAAHTITHPHLTTLSDAALNIELSDSQTYLQTTFGVVANDFASPFGEVDERVLEAVKNLYRSHRGVINGYNYKDGFDIYNLKVQNVLLTTSPSEIAGWLNEAANSKTWLILVFHQIDNGGDTYSSTPENFANYLGVINGSGLPVVTLDQALNEVLPQTNN
ncbi:MAG TPA: polysaccharide deacetylase family protein [Candidatus Nanoarchaeia archaeon]|nr:hypothetical protein [uncultured archaeon]